MDYLSIAVDAAKEEFGNFDPSKSRILSKEISKDTVPQNVIDERIPELNIPGISNVKNIGPETIQNSELNNILNYETYQRIITNIAKLNVKTFGKNWGSVHDNKSFLFNEVLGHCYRINTALINGRISGSTNWHEIQSYMIGIFRIVISLGIKHKTEVTFYSILSANQKTFEQNPEAKLEVFDESFWEMFMIPVMLKQPQLLAIKFIEFWLYLGKDINVLFQESLGE
jgi:hypothetical protein